MRGQTDSQASITVVAGTSSEDDGSHDENKLVKGSRSFNPFVLLPPAMCDMIATSVMYIGLNFTYASSFQMLRGAVIVFVGIFSMLFLGRKLVAREWCGIVFVIFGLGLVGLSDILIPKNSVHDSSKLLNLNAPDEHTTNDIILGDLLIIGAQVVAATQMVLEEKFVSGLDIPPLQAVGWEGLFGFTTLGLLLIPFYYIHVPESFSGNSRSVLEDALEAFVQMGNNNLIILAIVGTVVSIAFFNFAGISVTKEMSATTRMVLDSVRTLFIWIFSLALEWQKFHWLQVIGFVLLILGMALYNNVFVMQSIHKLMNCCRRPSAAGTESLIGNVSNASEIPNTAGTTMCDMIASCVMYVGLVFTYASSYEMLRGAVIVFVGIFSMLFLGRKLGAREWCGIVFVIFGLSLVGLSDFLIHTHSDQDESNSDIDKQYNIIEVVIGDVLIVSAQVVAATQFILEEKFVSSLDIPPLQAVGWEVLLVSIAFFNFAGISVTKEMSATTRMVLNSLRTLFIWIVSLALEWQKFHWVQVIGFFVLILGIALYNDVFVMQAIHKLNNCIRHLRNRGTESTTEPSTNESNLPTSAIGDETTE
uniref:EamA domain-containing protein n=1 Tax=Timema poppense TaxID=170557 RepID=A0A7R9CR35_TIMPO|nr:unnamed protein product [Timema poppensis]